MAALNSHTNTTLIKWRRVKLDAMARISRRLKLIQRSNLVNVPRVVAFGFCEDICRLEIERIHGRALLPSDLVHAELKTTLKQWQQNGFVHGDLSRRNILVDAEGKAWCIDWILDLESYEGTPKYASKEVFLGRHTFNSDQHALHCIFAESEDLAPAL